MYHDFLQTPIGILKLVADETHLLSVGLAPLAGEGNSNAVCEHAKVQLREYFAGKRRQFDLPLHSGGSDFQKQVWSQLRKIPFGETRSYGQIAEALGRKAGSSRAVGGANNKNPHMIVVPCHRVIGRNGNLVGFAPGVQYQDWLLKHEMEIQAQGF